MARFTLKNEAQNTPAKTGRDKSKSQAVIKTDQTKRGRADIVIPGALILNIVVIIFIEPSRLEIPAICRLYID